MSGERPGCNHLEVHPLYCSHGHLIDSASLNLLRHCPWAVPLIPADANPLNESIKRIVQCSKHLGDNTLDYVANSVQESCGICDSRPRFTTDQHVPEPSDGAERLLKGSLIDDATGGSVEFAKADTVSVLLLKHERGRRTTGTVWRTVPVR